MKNGQERIGRNSEGRQGMENGGIGGLPLTLDISGEEKLGSERNWGQGYTFDKESDRVK